MVRRVASLCVVVVVAACGPQRPPAAPKAYKVYVAHPYYVNFVPFGAGQFQNGERGKGAAFAVGQGVTAMTSAGIWVYLVKKYGYGGLVAREDEATARRLQQVQIGSTVAFAGLAAWGIIDALVHHEPYVELSDGSVTVGPAVVPGGAGIAVTWSR